MPINLEALRRHLGKRSISDVAEAAQMTRANLSALINGRQTNPGLETLERLAKVLGVRVSRLMR